MEIKGRRLEVNGYLTTNDLEIGEVFIFLDDSKNIWMMGEDAVYINLENGEMFYTYEPNVESKPIRRVKCHLEVEGFA
jgi:hypothetical protein